MAFTAIAAIAGGAEVTATLALAAVAEVGTAMTVIGAVTGNKDLMKIGGVMGLVGGIGGLIAGAGDAAVSAVADTAGNTAQEGFRASEIGAENAGSNVASAASDATTAGSSVLPSGAASPVTAEATLPTTGANAQPIPQPDSITQSVQPAPVDQTPIAQSGPTQGAQAPIGANAPTVRTVTAPSSPADTSVGGLYGPDNIDVGGGFNPAGAPNNSSSFFGQFGTWAQNNQKLLAGGMQLLGGAMSGANQRDMFDQQMALKQQQMRIANSVGSITPRPTGLVQGATV